VIDSGLLISIAACVLAVLAVDRLHPAGMRRSWWFDLASCRACLVWWRAAWSRWPSRTRLASPASGVC